MTWRIGPAAPGRSHNVPQHLERNVIITISLQVDAAGNVSCFVNTGALGRTQDAPAQDLTPVAGRIEAAADLDLLPAIDAWIDELRARGKASATVRQYRALAVSLVESLGWQRVAEIDGGALLAEFARRVNDGAWSGGTYNRNIIACRSLTRWLTRSGRLAADPLVDAERAEDDAGEGARAATLEESRAMIAYAHSRELADRRAKSSRALYYTMMFSMGLRAEEPLLLQWQPHVFLDDAHPHVVMHKAIQKNRRTQELPIPPALVPLLLEHRDRMRILAAAEPVIRQSQRRGRTAPQGRLVHPDDPQAYVFPHTISRPTFRADRDAVGILAKDRKGRGFSCHSARKFFETHLIGVGVPSRMVDRLMRHHIDTAARYYDPTMAEMAEAVSHIPSLWPVSSCAGRALETGGHPVDNPTPVNRQLQPADGSGNHLVAARIRVDSASPPAERPRAALGRSPSAAGNGESQPEPSTARAASAPRARSSKSDPVMPITTSITSGSDPAAIADLLESIARLLRSRGDVTFNDAAG